MNRKDRRAAAHNQRKLVRKAGFPAPQPRPRRAVDTPEPTPLSTAQLTANRANAQLSTGPRTETGRAISSQNHTTHGLARHNGAFVLLPSEDPNAFAALKASLLAEYQPSTETESILVNSMAESHWLANRAQTLQNTCLDPQTGQIADAALFALYLRYQTTHTRAFHKCLNDLLKLRSERRKTENGFEAQNRKKEERRIQSERHQMKKDHHEWDIRLKDAAFCHRAGQNVINFMKATLENPGFEAQYRRSRPPPPKSPPGGGHSRRLASSALYYSRSHKRLLYLSFLSMPTADTVLDIDTPSETASSGGDKKIMLLKPRGFCAGVVRAIDVVKIALDLYGAPIYVRKEIVHNRHVVDELRQAGAIFVEELAEVPEGARVIFSAHGVAPSVRQEATSASCSSSTRLARWSPKSTWKPSNLPSKVSPSSSSAIAIMTK